MSPKVLIRNAPRAHKHRVLVQRIPREADLIPRTHIRKNSEPNRFTCWVQKAERHSSSSGPTLSVHV